MKQSITWKVRLARLYTVSSFRRVVIWSSFEVHKIAHVEAFYKYSAHVETRSQKSQRFNNAFSFKYLKTALPGALLCKVPQKSPASCLIYIKCILIKLFFSTFVIYVLVIRTGYRQIVWSSIIARQYFKISGNFESGTFFLLWPVIKKGL